ncbi:DUF5060 domain-containing protein [Sphingomicrobium arenosum]|uniref:DUF5060 domain-containing protein n=1 Tax=Sphingomicrobium arenosum TaxID=2233861 RepID=UPI0022407103|nr:DUF5060 domain-containing protein [Sphingomicrobium arenosum]
MTPHLILAAMLAPAEPAHGVVDGVAVIEAEDVVLRGDWRRVADEDASRGAAIHYGGPNRYALDGSEVGASLRYCVMVEEPGDYALRLRMKRSRAGEPDIREDERNDYWLRLSGGQWMKLFANTPWEEYGWDGGLDFHHLTGRRPEAALTFEAAGLNCFEIAGRSEAVRLDAIMLSLGDPDVKTARASTLLAAGPHVGSVHHPVTIDVEGPEANEGGRLNPFTERRLALTVTAPDGEQIVLRGFFAGDGDAGTSGAAGGTVWRALFTPDAPGLWRWEARLAGGEDIAVSRDWAAGETLAESEGEVTVLPSLAQGTDWRAQEMGRLTVEDGEYRLGGSGRIWLKSGTNSPENLLGFHEFDDTYRMASNAREGEAAASLDLHRFAAHEKDWREGDPTWGDDGRGKALIGAVNYLADQGVNSAYFLLWNVGGDGKDVWPFVDPDDMTRFDISKLDQWQTLFAHLQARGIALHLVLQETENELVMDGGDTGTIRKLYFAEMAARFGHHNALIWNLGEENGPVHWRPEGQSTAQREAMIDWLSAVDPYDHPILLHTLPNPEDKDDILPPLLGYEGLDGLSFQVSDPAAVKAETLRWARASRAAGQPWALSMDEIGPWMHGAVPDADSEDGHRALAREALWGHLLAGGSGVEWYFGAQHDHNDLTAEDFRSRDKLWRISSAARRLVEDTFDLATRRPCDGRFEDYKCLQGITPDGLKAIMLYLEAGEAVPAELLTGISIEFRDPLAAGSPIEGGPAHDRIVIAKD